MKLNEEPITKAVCVFILIFGLSIVLYYLKIGYKSLVLYITPMTFIIVALLGLFKENISRFFNQDVTKKQKEAIKKHENSIFTIIFPLFFSIVGFVLLFVAIKFPENVPILGWITILVFALFPLIIVYGLLFGFPISEKQLAKQEARRDKLSFDDEGILIEMPLFDKNCFISWKSVEAVIYYNYIVSSDFIEYYQGFKFYLTDVPKYTKHEKQLFINRLFKDSKSKVVDITDDTKGYRDITKMIETYLLSKVDIDFSNPLKGKLISSTTTKSKDKTVVVEKWKPRENEREKIIYNRQNLSIEEIKKNFR